MAKKRKLRFSLVSLLTAVAALCVIAFYSSAEDLLAKVPENRAGTPSGEFVFPEKLRVATYNLHNFRDENRVNENGVFRYKHPKSEKEKKLLYKTILEVRPDILAVQEIGGKIWLDELAAALAREGLEYPYRVLLEGYDKHNRNAILSRVPFSKTIALKMNRQMTRGVLGIVVPVAGGQLFHVYNVHLKSKVSNEPDDPECVQRRSREARVVRRVVEFGIDDEKLAEKINGAARFVPPQNIARRKTPKLFVIVGDFNDVPASSPLAPLEAETFATALPAKNDDGGVFTYFNPHHGYFHTFDRLFVSPEIYKKFYVPESAKIAEFSWSQKASDHRLVYADFDFSESKEK